METTQKNRQETRKRRRPAEESRKKRPAQQQEEATPRKKPAQQQTKARRPRQEEGAPRKRTSETPETAGPKPTLEQRQAARRKANAQRKPAPDPNQKRTLKDNPLQKFLNGEKPAQEPQQPDKAQEATQRREKRAAEAQRKRKQAQRDNTPAVIYTQPEVFNRNIFLVRVVTVLAVVAAMIVGMSVFFRVENIQVAGAKTYSSWTVREAAGISEGDGLLTFSRAKANAQLQAKLPYVENSRIGIKLPNTVIIYIEEAEVTYAIKSADNIWYLMTSSGTVVEQVDNDEASDHTQITGVTIQTPTIGEPAVATEELPETLPTETADPTDPTAETTVQVPVILTGALRLNAALEILKALEANDIVGDAASVDVSRLEDIVLWYDDQYQVELGDTSRMEYKIACMTDAILQMSEFDTGILDVSFDIWEDKVVYTPFS